jgi:hypothetical protein
MDGTARGIKLAADEINAAGGVKVGNTKRPFKVEVIDTRDLEPGVPVSEALWVWKSSYSKRRRISLSGARTVGSGPLPQWTF